MTEKTGKGACGRRGKSIFTWATAFLLALGLANPAPLHCQVAKAAPEDLQRSLTYTFGGVTGIELISGLKNPASGATTTVGAGGASAAAGDTTFRIGSQSKMFTAAVVLDIIDKSGGALTLDTTIGELVQGYPSVEAKLPDGIDARAGQVTLRQLLSMNTDLPNYLAGVPDGQSEMLVELWMNSTAGGATGGYGAVPGFTSQDPDAHKDLAGLAVSGPPSPPQSPFTGVYSNSNAVILALIAEGLEGQAFDRLLSDWLVKNGVTDTSLQVAQGQDPNMIGSSGGKKIVNLDPTIPWVSGAVVTNMNNLLKSLELFKDDPTRMAEGNTTVIDMHGMPTIYGLGLMDVDFSFISDLMGLPTPMSPVYSVGHGGAIAGAGSFSGWLGSHDSIGLDLGLATYANLSDAYTPGGIYTSTPSEMLFVTLAEHLYRLQRADGSYAENTGNVTINYGSKGGFAASAAPGTVGGLSFTKAEGQTVPLIAYFDWDSMVPQSVAVTLDPVFTHYSTSTEASRAASSETAVTAQGRVDLPAWARMEGYSGERVPGGSSYTLLELAYGNADDSLSGQVAVYGSNATALKTFRQINLGSSSVAEAHGYNSTALKFLTLQDAANSVTGQVLAVGAKVRAVEVGGGNAASKAAIGPGAVVTAVSLGSSLVDFNGTTVDPLENGAVGIRVFDNSVATVGGQVTALSLDQSQHQPISVGLDLVGVGSKTDVNGGQVTSTGYGARLAGIDSVISLTDQASLAGDLYAIFIDDSAAAAAINLFGGSRAVGGIKAENPNETNAVMRADAASSVVGKDYSTPVIDGIHSVELEGTTIAWRTGDLPERGRTITVVDNFNEAASDLGYRLDFGGNQAVGYSASLGRATVLGLADGAYRSPNAPLLYDAWQAATLGTGQGKIFIGDADNLSPEPFVTLGGAALDAHRQNARLARRALFPDDASGSVYAAPAYLGARPIGSDSRSAGLAAMYDRQVFSGLVDGWAPADPASLSFLSAASGLGSLQAAPAAGAGDWGPRFVFDYFHTSSSRDDDAYSGYDHDRDGLLAGLTADLGQGVSLGAYFGWSKGDADFNYLRAEADTESVFGGVMGRWRQGLSENLAARFTADLSLNRVDNDLDRSVVGLAGLESRLTDSFRQRLIGVGLEAALDWNPAGDAKTRLSPWLGLDYAHLKQDGLRESASGPGAPALWADGFDADAFYSAVGLAASHDFQLSATNVMTVKASGAWEHQFGDRSFITDGGFLAGGPAFQARSLAMDRDAAVLGLAANVLHQLDNGDLFGLAAGYEARVMSGGNDQQISVGLEYRF